MQNDEWYREGELGTLACPVVSTEAEGHSVKLKGKNSNTI